jgi:DNA polymerase-1
MQVKGLKEGEEVLSTLEVGAYQYDIIMYKPGMPIFQSKMLAIDTETEWIIDGKPIIPVIAQICDHDNRRICVVSWEHMFDYMRELIRLNPEALFVFHNAPFDLHVLGLDGELKEEWLKLITRNQIIDTGIRFLLRNLDIGSSLMKWKLDLVAKMLLKIPMSKDVEIRGGFRRGMILRKKDLVYACKDAAVTAQAAVMMPEPYPTETIQLLGYIALSDISRRGFLVDRTYLKAKYEELTKRVEDNVSICSMWGWNKGEHGNSFVFEEIVDKLERRVQNKMNLPELSFPRTPKTKKIKATEETMDLFGATPHSFLKSWKDIQGDEKVISTYLQESKIGADGRVHSTFSPLVKTGRTSSSNPNLQNLPRKGEIRGVYIPPKGKLLYACDYSQLELCALSETCLYRYGHSRMADVINSGEDLHAWFGEAIMETCGGHKGQIDQHGNEINWRQQAKACNFGFPGGMGALRFIIQSKATYGVDFTMDQAIMLKELWLATFPEMGEHLSPPEDPKYYPSGDKDEDGKEIMRADRYIAQTINGRVRRGASYCSACNYPFQGLSADGAKMALWYLYLSGFDVVNFIHDETITELDEDDTLQARCAEIDRLMLAGMKTVIKNVLVKVEGGLMRRWHKGAEPVFDSDIEGSRRLLVWEPGIVTSRFNQGLKTFDIKGKLLVPKKPTAAEKKS